MKTIYIVVSSLLISVTTQTFAGNEHSILESADSHLPENSGRELILERESYDNVRPDLDQKTLEVIEEVHEIASLEDQLESDDQSAMHQTAIYVDAEEEGMSDEINDQQYQEYDSLQEGFIEVKLPGEEIDFALKLFGNNLHFVNGRANSDIGKILFKSRLMPSNEVKLSLKLKQREVDDIELVAYFDLANFEMELDGSNAVLNKEHKALMSVLNQHLRAEFEEQYRDYDFPEHAFMLVQMLSYWSVSPEGYVHEKREIVAEY